MPRQQALTAAAQPVPPGVIATMLVDTGASGTAIDPGVLAPLNLTPSGSASVQTPTTGTVPQACSTFDVSIMLRAPAGAPLFIEALPIIESTLRPQGIDGLLGCDVLDRCVFTYNGPGNIFTLSF